MSWKASEAEIALVKQCNIGGKDSYRVLTVKLERLVKTNAVLMSSEAGRCRYLNRQFQSNENRLIGFSNQPMKWATDDSIGCDLQTAEPNGNIESIVKVSHDL